MKLTMHRGHSHLRPDDVLALLLLVIIVVTAIGAMFVLWHMPSTLPINWGTAPFPS
jgi:hypothetical protein